MKWQSLEIFVEHLYKNLGEKSIQVINDALKKKGVALSNI